MCTVKVGYGDFHFAFDRDVDFDPYPYSAYIDLTNGEVIWVFEDDEDPEGGWDISPEENREARIFVQSDPDRFLLIPGRSHDEYHKIFRKFMDSEWTDDQELRENVKSVFIGSIGGWKKSIEHGCYKGNTESRTIEILEFWRDYEQSRIDEKTGEFLETHNIELH